MTSVQQVVETVGEEVEGEDGKDQREARKQG
jgi:hypothetical protein